MPEAVVIDIISSIQHIGLLELMECKDRQIQIAYLEQDCKIEGQRCKQKIRENPDGSQTVIDYIEERHLFVPVPQD